MLRKTILSGIAMLSLLACEPLAELDPVLKVGGPAAISSPAAGAVFVLEEANADQPFGTITWTAVDFGFQAAVKYTVQMDKAGNSFATPINLGVVSTTSLDNLTVGGVNAVMLANGFPDNVEAAMEMRIMAEVNPDVDPVFSNPVPMSIKPYKSVIVYPQLGVPGSYQGWNPGDSTTAVFSRRSDNTFEGYAYFEAAAEFKYTQGPSWDTNWGDDGADGTLDPAGANIAAPDPGMYRLNVNLNDLTHTYAKTDWGLIGSATPGGWDSDQDMTYDLATKALSITIDLVVGEIKFRANDDWAVNFGDDAGNGSLEYGGANIAIAEAGNYTINLLLSGSDYTYSVVKN